MECWLSLFSSFVKHINCLCSFSIKLLLNTQFVVSTLAGPSRTTLNIILYFFAKYRDFMLSQQTHSIVQLNSFYKVC